MEQEKNNSGQNKASDQAIKNLSPERDSYYLSFILKKTEKLVTAVYLITDFLNSNEPLKWEIRSKSVRLMSFVSATASQNSTADGIPFSRVPGAITDIVSVLELAASLRFVSEMNFSILRDEFTSLRSLIEGRERANNPIADVSFSHEFFTTGIESRLPARSAARPPIRTPQPSPKNASEEGSQAVSEVPEDDGQAPPRQPIAKPPETRSWPPSIARGSEAASARNGHLPKSDEKSLRQETILKFLRSRSGSSIKDIASVIPNCSEKTVQRELIELMDSGLIIRSGERRWSTYSLVE